MAGRYNPKYGYPNSPEWDEDSRSMKDGTDCFLDNETNYDCDDVLCHACGPGQMSSAYALNCTSCTPGRFQDASISSNCKFCTAGQFSQNNGSVVCKFNFLFLSSGLPGFCFFFFLTFDLFILIFFPSVTLIYRFNMSSGVV